jgi:hypothetical protein
MDDYTSNVLNDSKNEWSILLINHITPHIIDGFRSIFNEAVRLCEENDELEKYLMTYQNLLARIPKWNQQMIQTEYERIVKLCNCSYLEDILTCVHIIQLKVLSCVRVSNETKKVKIDIPEFSVFLHNVYTNIARKLYSSIYLFEIDITPLEQQKHNREFELLVQTCIMNTIRDKIPVETILRQFIDETQEIEVSKVEKVIETKPLNDNVSNVNVSNNNVSNVNVVNNSVSNNSMANNIENNERTPNKYISEPNKPFTLPNNFNNMPSFFDKSNDLNNEIDKFEKLAQENTIINSVTNNSPRVGFTNQNSVLTFDSPSEDSVSLGEPIQLNSFEIEELEPSKNETKPSEQIKLDFEEL